MAFKREERKKKEEREEVIAEQHTQRAGLRKEVKEKKKLMHT
jgi:hypothetical protein